MKAISRGTAAIPVSRIKLTREFEAPCKYPHSKLVWVTVRKSTKQSTKRQACAAPLTDKELQFLRDALYNITYCIIKYSSVSDKMHQYHFEALKEFNQYGVLATANSAYELYKLCNLFVIYQGARFTPSMIDAMGQYKDRYERFCLGHSWDPQLHQPIIYEC